MAKKRLGDPNEYKGIKQIDGTIDNFSDDVFENGYLYLVRTSQDKKHGYIYLNGKKYGNFQLYDGCVGEHELHDDAVTENKIKDGSVTEDKLSESVQGHLLTDDMIEYLKVAIYNHMQSEAQGLFSGYTIKPEKTTYIYGVETPSPSQFAVRVGLTFDGEPVHADYITDEWYEMDDEYVRLFSLDEEIQSIPSELFVCTLADGKYSGHTVIYRSEVADMTRLYPMFFGFSTTNNPSDLTNAMANLTYSAADEINEDGVDFVNNTGFPAYFCIVTRGSATLSQMGVNLLTDSQDVQNFASIYNGRQMEGYKVYYTKNTVANGNMLSNVKINIQQ